MADEDVSLRERFLKVERIVDDIQSGRFEVKTLQNEIHKAVLILEELTTEVSTMSLFSDNETLDEVSTSSLRFLLLPAYLGVLHSNIMTELDVRAAQLVIVKIYYRDYLKRVRNYGVISVFLPWIEDEDDIDEGKYELVPKVGGPKQKFSGEQQRQTKLARYRLEKELAEKLAAAKKNEQHCISDEAGQRETFISQLRYWAVKCYEDLESVEEEIPMVERMCAERVARSGDSNSANPLVEGERSEALKERKPLKPFIIARTEQQKQVLGLGYPSIPTMTVDEWYTKRFGNNPSAAPNQQQSAKGDCHEDCSDSEHEDDPLQDDIRRFKAMRWDEYKDDHRRGWGNTKNKG